MGELILKAASHQSVAHSLDLIMPKQFAVQTRTIILNMLVRDRINDEFICIYNSIEKHITELVSRDCQVLSFILLSLYYHVEVYED